MKRIELQLPRRLSGFFSPGPRYHILHGGRGSGKSWSVADYLLIAGMQRQHLILCCREIQKSIKDSVKRLLDARIAHHGLEWFYRSTDTSIRGANGTEFIFAGLWRNVESVIKSMEGVTICWVEEGQTISRDSWQVLVPTIRQPGSFIIVTMNPRFPDDPIYADFIADPSLRPDARVLQMNWRHNPWFSPELKAEMLFQRRSNYAVYLHIWEGEILIDDEALVFGNNVQCKYFDTPIQVEFLFGADFGYAQDPSTLNRTFMLPDDDRTIYLDYEAHGVRTEIDDLPALYAKVPLSKRGPITADSARPETINYLARRGYNIRGAKKGPGSVEDGIAFLQSMNIIIHPRCPFTLAEFKTHKFRRHTQTNLVLPITEDTNNHHIDGTRYAYEGHGLRDHFFASVH